MANERPDNWHPPAQELGGENIPALFAIMLLGDIVGTICRKTKNFSHPITQGMDELEEKEETVFTRLKQSGHFFYQGNGSLFSDFKILRAEANRKTGVAMGVENPNEARVAGFSAVMMKFSPDMPTSEALELAMRIVASWDWEQEAK